MTFQFFNRRRRRLEEEDRAEARLAAERAHQALMLSTFMNSLESIQELSGRETAKANESLVAVAGAIAQQAQAFGEWMKLFQAGSPPTSSKVTDEDEYRDEQMHLALKGLPSDVDALPEEFKLQWILKNDPNLLDADS